MPIEPPDTIKDEELVILVRKLTGRHCGRLIDAFGPKATLRKTIDIIIEDNRSAIFDTQRMLRDWVEKQTCPAEETRRILKECAEKTGRGDLEGLLTNLYKNVFFFLNYTGSLLVSIYRS